MSHLERAFSGTYEVKFDYVFLKLIVRVCELTEETWKESQLKSLFLPFLEPKILLIYVLWTKNEFLLGAMLQFRKCLEEKFTSHVAL